MPPTVKSLVDNVVNNLLSGENNPLAFEYINYLHVAKEHSELYGGDYNIKQYILKAYENLRKVLLIPF